MVFTENGFPATELPAVIANAASATTDARKIEGWENLETAYSDYLDENTTFSTEADRLAWFDARLNEVYAAVRTVLPAERFAAVKKEQIAWLKGLEATDGIAKKCERIAARIKELRALAW